MADASLAPIYERLNSTPAFHPLTAETFADWAMEAGDMVTVSRDGTAYTSPVSTSRMTWRGRQEISIESTGTREREAISKTSRKKYSRGGGSLTNNNYIYHQITDEDGILKTTIMATESVIMTEVSNGYEGLTSTITQTASSIRLEVSDSYNGLASSITQTASSIRSEVSNSYKGLTSTITQTASSIRSEVSSSYKGLSSTITQTASSIRSEVSSSYAGLASSITQTASNIRVEVSNSYKGLSATISVTESTLRSLISESRSNSIFPQWDDPAGTHGSELKEGDLWIKTNGIETWDDFFNADVAWDDVTWNWDDLKGSLVYVRRDGRWQLVSDEQTVASLTDIDQTNEYIALMARAIDTVDGKLSASEARLEVTAKQIESKVNNRTEEIGSRITQTASSIRAEVTDAKNGLASSIQQTASSIRTEVNNYAEGLASSIEQTASSIRMEVNNYAEGLSSAITQTASSIRMEVSNSYKGLSSSITQTASSIQAVVSNDYKGLTSTITQTASSIRMEVSNSYKGLSSSITQTASSIRSEVSNSYKGLSSSITQTASSIRSEVSNSYKGLSSTIVQTASSVQVTVSNNYAGLTSKITQTASSILITVSNNYSGLTSKITQTASSILHVVSDDYEGLSSEIVQTASSIQSTVSKNYSGLSSKIVQTASSILHVVSDDYEGLTSEIIQTASSILHVVSDDYGGLTSKIIQTASSIMQVVSDDYTGLSGRISTESSRISLVVSGSGASAAIRPAQIVAAINDSESSVKLDADKVYIGNTKSTTVIAGKAALSDVTADYIAGKIATITDVNVLKIHSERGSANFYTVSASNVLNVGGVDCSMLPNSVRTLQITQSGNTYKLQKKTYASDEWQDVGSFSRATTLSGAWSGDNTGDTATYTVTASPQGNTESSAVVLKLNQNAAYVTDPGGTIRARLDNPWYDNGWYDGYDSNGTAFIGDENSENVGGQTLTIDPGGTVSLWPAYTNWDGTVVWPDSNARKVVVKANPASHNPTVDSGSFGNIDKSSSAAASFISGLTRAKSGVLLTGQYYRFTVKCGGNSKTYYFET